MKWYSLSLIFNLSDLKRKHFTLKIEDVVKKIPVDTSQFRILTREWGKTFWSSTICRLEIISVRTSLFCIMSAASEKYPKHLHVYCLCKDKSVQVISERGKTGFLTMEEEQDLRKNRPKSRTRSWVRKNFMSLMRDCMVDEAWDTE